MSAEPPAVAGGAVGVEVAVVVGMLLATDNQYALRGKPNATAKSTTRYRRWFCTVGGVYTRGRCAATYRWHTFSRFVLMAHGCMGMAADRSTVFIISTALRTFQPIRRGNIRANVGSNILLSFLILDHANRFHKQFVKPARCGSGFCAP